MNSYNSSKNQKIKRKFVESEVIHAVNSLDPDNQEALFSLQSTPDYESAVKESEYHIIYSDYNGGYVWVNRELHIVSDNSFISVYDVCKDCCIENNIDYDYNEALEHWVVTDYIGKKLKDKGEIIEEFQGLTIWGRCTSGQAILLDCVISEICNDINILSGQKYEWAV